MTYYIYFLYPLKVDLSGTYLKVVFGDTKIHLRMANHGESLLGSYLMTVVVHADILKRELLLVYGSWSLLFVNTIGDKHRLRRFEEDHGSWSFSQQFTKLSSK